MPNVRWRLPGPDAPSRGFDAPTAIGANIVVHIVAGAGQVLYPLMTPIILTQFGMTPAGVGLLFSAQMAIFSVAALLVAASIGRIDLRMVCAAMFVVHIAGNIVAVTADTLPVFAAARLVTSAADGIMLCAGNVAFAPTRNPPRVYGICWLCVGLVSSGIGFLAAAHIETAGVGAVLGPLALVAVIGLPALIWMPSGTDPARPGRVRGPRTSGVPLGVTGIVLLVGCCLFFAASSTTTPFVALIGREVGVTLPAMARTTAVAALAGTLAPVVAIVVGLRFGRGIPLIVIGALLATCIATIGLAATPALFAGTYILFQATYRSSPPYILGTLARHDRSGRLSAASSAMTGLGYAIGPIVGGTLYAQSGSFALVTLAGAAIFVAGIGPMAWIALREDREDRLPRDVVTA